MTKHIQTKKASCANCGVRYACPHIHDTLEPCNLWFEGNGYGSPLIKNHNNDKEE